MTSLSSPPPSPLFQRAFSSSSRSSTHGMPLGVSNVASLFVKMRRHKTKAKAHHIDSSSGDVPLTHPALAADGAVSARRVPLTPEDATLDLGRGVALASIAVDCRYWVPELAMPESTDAKGTDCEEDGGGRSTSPVSECAPSRVWTLVTESERGFFGRGRGTILGLGVGASGGGALEDPATLVISTSLWIAAFEARTDGLRRFVGLAASDSPVSLLISMTRLPAVGPAFLPRAFLFPEPGGDETCSALDSTSV